MIFSTSCSGNKAVLFLLAAPLFLCACAAVRTSGDPAGDPPVPKRAEVVPKLVVESVGADRESPQAAEMTTVSWSARVTGGVGARRYTFFLSDGVEDRRVQEGPSSSWSWRPSAAGHYRVRVVVRDSIGNVAEGAWASDYVISPAFEQGSTVAVMPVENLSGTAAPVKEIRASWIAVLKERGMRILEERVLEEFLARHRIRYTGGMTKELGEALRKETGARGILFTALDLYGEPFPPKVALTARLVYAGGWAGILWMDGVAMAGNDSPGILGIGLIRDPRALREKAMRRLAGSLEGFLSGKIPRTMSAPPSEGERRFRPKEFYRSPQAAVKKEGPLVVAVLPFQDETRRRNIGEIMMLHFVRFLSGLPNVKVVEPGVVRQALLTSRTIMEQGLSLPQADLLRELLDVDLVFAGWVMDYQDFQGPAGTPKVRFTSEVIDTRKRQVLWSALSYGRGDDGVFFFDAGKVNTAHAVASRMVRGVVANIMREKGPSREIER